MTPEIILVLGILVVVIAVLVTEAMPLEVLALLVLGTLALTGLVTPTEALSGFSNPAVVTIWAVFILSGGLTRTGIANILGRYLLQLAGSGRMKMMILIMLIAGGLSAFMNNVAVAALMLPVVMDICRKTKTSPSLMLMPLAYGSLLGGLTTMIGTPPNILVSEALRTHGLTPFGLFDFTPVGLVVMVSGILFVTFVGSRLLPRQDLVAEEKVGRGGELLQYRIHERLFKIKIPEASALVGRTLKESRLGSHLDLNVVGISRGRKTLLAPSGREQIHAGDELIVEGLLERVQEMNHWGQLRDETARQSQVNVIGQSMNVVRLTLGAGSSFIGKTLSQLNFRNHYRMNVLAVLREEVVLKEKIKYLHLQEGDILMVYGAPSEIKALLTEKSGELAVSEDAESLLEKELVDEMRIFAIPDSSKLLGKTLSKSCLGDGLDLQIVNIFKNDGAVIMPSSDTLLEPGDRLVVVGVPDLVADLLLQGLQAVFVQGDGHLENLAELEDDSTGMIEVVLSPHSGHSGKTLADLSFREKYNLSVLAIWRKGQAIRTGLRDVQLQFGDALLLHGSWEKLAVLGREPDFIVLTENVQEVAREEKAKVALTIMALVLFPVIMGWVPIYIGVVIGAAFMVLSKCLTMEEAYRFIEWKAVFLIAGMLPLGAALEKTGAAALVAEQTMALLGPFGPYGVLFGLLVITFAATSIIPTAALVVLMVPIALQTSAGLGISPYPLMMGIAMAASSSFTSPISHPANVLVMGPGGYRFMDYVKLGLPLTLVILVVLMVVIPLFWPLTVAG